MLGAAKINFISKYTVTAVAEVIRKKKGIVAIGNASITNSSSKFGETSAGFDGTGDYLIVSEPTDFAFGTNDFTVEMWVRFTALPSAGNYVVFYDHRPTSGSGAYITLTLKGSTIVFYANADRITSSTVSANTWYHLAVSRSGTSTKMFVNGTQAGSTYTDSTSYLSPKMYLGGDSFSNTSLYNGRIDELRISNTARYTANFTQPTAPFVNDENTLLLMHMDGTDASTYFEDDNGIRSPKGLTAYANAQVDTAQSKFGGSSLLLDGAGDYISVAPNTDFVLGTNNWTAEYWIRHSSQAACAHIDTRSTSGVNGICLYYTGSALTYYTGGSIRITGSALSNNTWYHVALVRNGNDHKLYINGTQSGSTWTSTNSITSVATYISIGAASDTAGNLGTPGHMDEVRISNTARYTANFTAPTAPFVNDANTLLLIHADGKDASTVVRDDNGVRTQKGIIANGNAQIDTAQSKFGGSSALFDGTDDYLKIYNNQAIGTGDFTVEFWFRKNRLGSQESLLDMRASGDGGPWFVHAGGPNQIYYYTASDFRLGHQTALSSTSVWYHVAYVRSSGTVRIYLDGVQSTSSYTDVQNYSNARDWFIGVDYSNGNDLNAWIDELRVSNTARYTANFTPSTTPFQNDDNTLLLLHMDGTDASTAFFDDNGVTPNWEY